MKAPLFLSLLFAVTPTAHAQAQEQVSIPVNRTATNIKIDGIADELSWRDAQTTSPFLNKWPLDSGTAVHQTQVQMLFDDEFLYVYAKMFQKKSDVVVQTLKRDQIMSFWTSDGFSILVDPINQKSTAYLFGVNAGGAQVEGAITLTGSWTRVNENWDNKWFSAVTVTEEFWTAELAIPFTALRFDESVGEWGLNFIRSDMKDNAFSTWSRVPLQFNGTDLGHLGTLHWAEKLTPKKSAVTVIPYLSGGQSRVHEDGEGVNTNANAGVDMKVALSSSLNLDLTYKPDFSNVEVDRQMTNVTRFSLLFPERRNFFLENADLFTNFGSWMAKPFFSRRIGLHDGNPVPILAGARVSGNITKGLRIGMMDIQTEATEEISANNYFVTAVQQQVLARSNIKIFGTNRQTTRAVEGDIQHDFNRAYGGEFQYLSKDGKWNGYLRAHNSETPEQLNHRNYLGGEFNYIDSKKYTGILIERVGENYINDLGFIPRLYNYDPVRDSTIRIGHYTVNPWLGFMIYPKNSKRINMIEPNTWSVVNYRTTGEFLERNTSVNFTVLFRNTAKLFTEAFNTSVDLPFAVDMIEDHEPIPVAKYNFTQYTIRYTTDSRKQFSGELSAGMGDFYNGIRKEYGGSLNFRVQPWGLFAVAYLQNDISLPSAYGKTSFKLIGPRAEISLRNNIWWTTFLQYNTQMDNFNINSRIQWRYRPMSDFFVVYTDNYATTDLHVKSRGIVFKATYWLNL